MKRLRLPLAVFIISGAITACYGSIDNIKVIDKMNSTNNWRFYHSENIKPSITTSSADTGINLQMNIDFKEQPGWVCISRKLQTNPLMWGAISFSVKSERNLPDIIELKLVGADGSTFGKAFPVSDLNSGWKTYKVKTDELSYWWGVSKELEKTDKIEIGVKGKGPVSLKFKDLKLHPVKIQITTSQTGYDPESPKTILVKGPKLEEAKPKLYFSIINIKKQKIMEGNLEPWDIKNWKGWFWFADFSGLEEPGQYTIQVFPENETPGYSPSESAPFNIEENILFSETMPAQLNFFRKMRWNPEKHPANEIKGGYYDTLFDTCMRPWSLTHVLRGLALAVTSAENINNKSLYRESLAELDYLTQFCMDIVQENGAVSWVGLNEFTRKRALDQSIIATGYNIAGLCEAAMVYKKTNPGKAKNTLDTAIKSWQFLNDKRLVSSADLGVFLWAGLKLFQATENRKYIVRSHSILQRLLITQRLDTGKFEHNACGRFTNNWNEDNFSNEYKYFVHGQGAINQALIDYCKILPPGFSGMV